MENEHEFYELQEGTVYACSTQIYFYQLRLYVTFLGQKNRTVYCTKNVFALLQFPFILRELLQKFRFLKGIACVLVLQIDNFRMVRVLIRHLFLIELSFSSASGF